MHEEDQSSWDDLDDRQEQLYKDRERIYYAGAKVLELASRPMTLENHSSVENALGLIRDIPDPLTRLSALESLSEELESERARIVLEL